MKDYGVFKIVLKMDSSENEVQNIIDKCVIDQDVHVVVTENHKMFLSTHLSNVVKLCMNYAANNPQIWTTSFVESFHTERILGDFTMMLYIRIEK